MSIEVYKIDQSDKWDAIVKSFSNHDVYWQSGYVKAFNIIGDGIPLLIYYEGNGTRAINVVMKRDIADIDKFKGLIEKNKYFDIVTPYGYGGWLIEGNGIEDMLCAYEKWCDENNIVCEFVRFHPLIKNNVGLENFYNVINLGTTIYIDLKDEETIFNNITSKNRNVIRKAIKNGVQIHRAKDIEIYKKFKEIYDQTMTNDNADIYYFFNDAFYKSIKEDLCDNAEVFYAQIEDGTIIAASIILYANGMLNYHLSGSIKSYQTLAPTNLLLYEVAKWGSNNGYKTLHLGGGVGSHEDSLYKFKAAFNRNGDLKYYIGKKIFIEDVYKKLSDYKFVEDGRNFFPTYRK